MSMAKRKPQGELKRGWTTGACATAAATAAYGALLTGTFSDPVTITLPGGQEPSFALSRHELDGERAVAGAIKDAGDDPDVTHGAEVVVQVERAKPDSGVVFRAGEGVGTVTLPGLPLAVGEPAINPAPRAMMESAVAGLAAKHNANSDVEITVSIPGGESLAEKTMNGRLGIQGGLSILGTTGVVIPYSCSSWIHSIHQGVDVARATGISHIAAATGSTSERAIAEMHGLGEQALIDMGDFAGGLLKHLRSHPVERLTLAGGFGKLTKLAQGNLDLHSSRSSVDMDALASALADLKAPPDIIKRVKSANTAMEVLELATDEGLAVADRIAAEARSVALATLSGGTRVEVCVFDRNGKLVGHADG